LDVPPERAKLPISRKRIMEAFVMLLRAGVIEDSGKRRVGRRGELEPVYRVGAQPRAVRHAQRWSRWRCWRPSFALPIALRVPRHDAGAAADRSPLDPRWNKCSD
jgi:hypothetical protein